MEQKLLEDIKNHCQVMMSKNNILSSVLAALVVYRSDYKMEEDPIIERTNNLFRLEVMDSWSGKYFDTEDLLIHEAATEKDKNHQLFRVYNSYAESIDDFCNYLLTERKSKNGPMKYAQITSVKSPSKAFAMLIRLNFLRDTWHRQSVQTDLWVDLMNTIVEKYNLKEWDQEVLDGVAPIKESTKYYVKLTAIDKPIFSSQVFENAKRVAENNIIKGPYAVYDDENNVVYNPWHREDTDPTYRVRLTWEENDTQILMTKIYEEAVNVASEHEGYKVFGEDGELLHNPWDKSNEPAQLKENDPVKAVKIIVPGSKVLGSDIPVYQSPYAKIPLFFANNRNSKSDIYYFDNAITNNRVRISKTNDPRVINGKNPLKVCGWVEV